MRVERRVMLIDIVRVAAGRVRLPELDQCVGHRASVFVEHAAGHDDALAQCLATGKAREVGVAWADQLGARTRPGYLGERVRDPNRRVPGRSFVRTHIGRVVVRRIDSLRRAPVAQQRAHLGFSCGVSIAFDIVASRLQITAGGR